MKCINCGKECDNRYGIMIVNNYSSNQLFGYLCSFCHEKAVDLLIERNCFIVKTNNWG